MNPNVMRNYFRPHVIVFGALLPVVMSTMAEFQLGDVGSKSQEGDVVHL